MSLLVFVHGVATRSTSAFVRESRNRDLIFRSALFADNALKIWAPVWGDLVPPLAWNGQSFPKLSDNPVSLGLLGGPPPAPLPKGTAGILGGADASSTVASLDALFGSLVDLANAEQRDLTDSELSQFRAAIDLLDKSRFNLTLAGATNAQFVDHFRNSAGVTANYGMLDSLKQAAEKVVDQARNLAGVGLVALFRDSLNPMVARFLGDIFVYLKPGQVRDKIRALIVHDLTEAFERSKATGEKLVLMGHSLGGVILYDLLSSPADLPKDFRAEALVTVGSQPGLFEELGLFDYQPPDWAPPAAMRGPGNVGLWFNIYDPIDLFGFRAHPVFSTSEDFSFDSSTGLLSAHTTYFKRPQFHARLRRRLLDAGVIAKGQS